MGTVHSGAVQTAQRDELPKREAKSRNKRCLITGFRARRHPEQRGLWADGWAGARLEEYGVNLRSPINDGLNCTSALREPCAGITERGEYTGLNATGCASRHGPGVAGVWRAVFRRGDNGSIGGGPR